MSSWNFKDNLTVDNNKFLKFLDSTGVTKNNILGLDVDSHLRINSSNVGDIYLNSNTTSSNTFINENNSFGNTFVASRLAVGITNTSNITSNIVLPLNGVVGLNSTQGSHTGYLALAASSSLLNTTGSRILLFGIDNTSGSSGQVQLYAGNSSTGNVNIYTGDDSLKLQVLNSGVTNFQPDGTTIRMSISDTNTSITNQVIISNTEPSTSPNTGALQITGGVGIGGNTYINGNLNVNSVSGNINFTSSRESTSYTSGATYLVGGFGIQCSVDSYSETAGGALSVAGGFALGKSAKIGGNITVYNSSASTSAVSGSGIFYGGVGINGQVNIRSSSAQQLRIVPTTNGNETSIFFGNQNNYTTTGSWVIGQNVNNVGSAGFALYNADSGNYMTFQNNNVNFQKYINFQDAVNFDSVSIADLLTIQNADGDINWSIGKIIGGNEDFQISRFTAGNLINYVLTADTKTGNVTIFGTENSTSSISGGSLTVNGGASIAKDLHIGGDIIGGNVNFTGSLISTSSNDVNSFTYLTLTATDESLSVTSGALVSFGGISIQSTTDTLSATNGGSFLTAGGASVAKSLIVGNTVSSSAIQTTDALSVNSTTTNHVLTNLTASNTLITNSTITNFYNDSQTVGSITNTNLTSTNASISTLYATELTSSNISVTNSTTTNELITNLNSINNTLSNLYLTHSTITNSVITNASITNITNTSSIITVASVGSLVVSTTANLKFNSNTLGNLFTTGGNVGIGVTAPTSALHVNGTITGTTQGYALVFGGGNGSAISGIGSDYRDIGIYSWGGLGITVAQNNGFTGIATVSPTYNLDVNGTLRSQSIVSIADTVNNVTNSIGSVNLSSDIALSNATSNNVMFRQAGVNPPTFSTRSSGTKVTLYPNISSNTMDFGIGVETNYMWSSSNSGFKWYCQSTSSNMILTNNGLGINTNDVPTTFALEVNGTAKVSSSLSALGNSNTIGTLYTTGGNVGINNVSPDYTFDVVGTGKFSSSLAAPGNSNTIGNIFTTGGNVGIQNTEPNQRLEISSIPYSANQDGGLRISTKDYVGLNDPSYRYIDLRLKSDVSSNYRGSIFGTLSGGVPTEYEYMSFSQDGVTNVYSQTKFFDSTSCSNSSIGSVVLFGGLSINCLTNATSVSNGGSLTIAGGASIAGDLIVGGTISYANAEAASSTFAYLTLTSTDFSTNIANGSLITFGGISIQTTADAFSSTQGNGLTVAGGVGIGASLYVGTNGYIPTVISTNNTTINAVLTNTSTANVYISNGLRSTFNSNTIGNIFTTGGNVGINTATPAYNFDVLGSFRSYSNVNGPPSSFYVGNFNSGSSAYGIVQIFNDTANNLSIFLNSTTRPIDGGPSCATIRNDGGPLKLSSLTGNTTFIYLTTTGNVGINNTDPTSSLDVSGVLTVRSTSNSVNSTSGAIIIAGGISVSSTSNATSTTAGGGLTIAGGASILKDVYVGGTVTSSSDVRLKKNLVPLENTLDKLHKFRNVRYNNKIISDERSFIGCIAQDFEQDFPELLYRNNTDAYYSLAYDRITSINMAAIKELHLLHKKLVAQVESLQEQNTCLQTQLNTLLIKLV